MNNTGSYIIINAVDVSTIYKAKDVKHAIGIYAEQNGISLSLTTFVEAIQHLKVGQAVELFNDCCIGNDNKIAHIIADFTTLYNAKEGEGADD